jgi:hypothetical protein
MYCITKIFGEYIMVRQSFFKPNNKGQEMSESALPIAEAVSVNEVCELVKQAKEILDDVSLMYGYNNIDKLNLLTQKYYESDEEEQKKVFDLLLEVVTLSPTHITFGEHPCASTDTKRFVRENREAYDNILSQNSNWDVESMKPK